MRERSLLSRKVRQDGPGKSIESFGHKRERVGGHNGSPALLLSGNRGVVGVGLGVVLADSPAVLEAFDFTAFVDDTQRLPLHRDVRQVLGIDLMDARDAHGFHDGCTDNLLRGLDFRLGRLATLAEIGNTMVEVVLARFDAEPRVGQAVLLAVLDVEGRGDIGGTEVLQDSDDVELKHGGLGLLVFLATVGEFFLEFRNHEVHEFGSNALFHNGRGV